MTPDNALERTGDLTRRNSATAAKSSCLSRCRSRAIRSKRCWKNSTVARGEDIPPGFVPHSTFWLVEGDAVVGVSNIRHRLTDALRADGGNIGYGIRPSCRGRGLARVLLQRTLEEARLLGLSTRRAGITHH